MRRILKTILSGAAIIAVLIPTVPAHAAPKKQSTALSIQLQKEDGRALSGKKGSLNSGKIGRQVVLSATVKAGRSLVSGQSIQFQQRKPGSKTWYDIGPQVITAGKSDSSHRARISVESLESTEYRAVYFGTSKLSAKNSSGVTHNMDTYGLHKVNCKNRILPCNTSQKQTQQIYNSVQSLTRDNSGASSVRALSLVTFPSLSKFPNSSVENKHDAIVRYLNGGYTPRYVSQNTRVSCINTHLTSFLISSIETKKAVGNAVGAVSYIDKKLSKRGAVKIAGVTVIKMTPQGFAFKKVASSYTKVVMQALEGATAVRSSKEIDTFLNDAISRCGVSPA